MYTVYCFGIIAVEILFSLLNIKLAPFKNFSLNIEKYFLQYVGELFGTEWMNADNHGTRNMVSHSDW
jgi:hypothetical protein